MDYSKVQNFIEKYAEEDDFTGGVSEDKIADIEHHLNVVLPESYKWFLKKVISDYFHTGNST